MLKVRLIVPCLVAAMGISGSSLAMRATNKSKLRNTVSKVRQRTMIGARTLRRAIGSVGSVTEVVRRVGRASPRILPKIKLTPLLRRPVRLALWALLGLAVAHTAALDIDSARLRELVVGAEAHAADSDPAAGTSEDAWATPANCFYGCDELETGQTYRRGERGYSYLVPENEGLESSPGGPDEADGPTMDAVRYELAGRDPSDDSHVRYYSTRVVQPRSGKKKPAQVQMYRWKIPLTWERRTTEGGLPSYGFAIKPSDRAGRELLVKWPWAGVLRFDVDWFDGANWYPWSRAAVFYGDDAAAGEPSGTRVEIPPDAQAMRVFNQLPMDDQQQARSLEPTLKMLVP